ncbi:hypothetical protein [Streptococcus sp. 263_SSPC]|uniref:YobI family P-loop NTPase n=1 Tax=Streptococcus sp. 263_SSPC TaxID=1579343 RepID=UPI0006603893|nr:hypothetical protein [Streptococcus sp. 263_SSPC]
MGKTENMKTNETTFNSLTPDILDENKKVYTDALDYAFGNSDIRNIAITGVYGAGKSTVWNTYRKYKLSNPEENTFKKIITVCLGKYEDKSDEKREDSSDEKREDSSLEDDENYSNNNKKDKVLDNRVERQIINQISAQIKSSDIPLSKYKFKGNLSGWSLWANIICTIFISCSILFMVYLKNIFIYLRGLLGDYLAIIITAVLFTMLFIVPVSYYLFHFYKKNKVKFSKVNFKVAEAQFTEINDDETVLERDMKEIVYLLSSSNTSIVVFEDLDRYDSVDIFVKLKELNFLLNAYLETNQMNRIVRFVYLIKDGLFYSEDRTKFFDFILPIIPIVNSKNSENHLLELINFVGIEEDERGVKELSKKTLWKLSLYIDDMRILRNIVNEYTIYSAVLPIREIELDRNKLLALVVVKNIFPHEFDLLQKDQGYIIDVFNKLETEKENNANKDKKKLKEINEKINFLENRFENDKFEAMALMIPTDLYFDNEEYTTWSELLKSWSSERGTSKQIDSRFRIVSASNYDSFVKQYILTDNKAVELIESLPEDKAIEINRLKKERNLLEKSLKNKNIINYTQLIPKMSDNERDAVFLTKNKTLKNNHYFGLIRFLIVEGLIDETYWYYKGNFDIKDSNALMSNDMIYMKGLMEGKEIDIFQEVESPEKITQRLEASEFNRSNSLNAEILRYCITTHRNDIVLALTDSVVENNKFKDLIRIIKEYEYLFLKEYVKILAENNIVNLVSILENSADENETLLLNLLKATFSLNSIGISELNLFKPYIQSNEKVINNITDSDFEVFFDNLKNVNVKFNSLKGVDATKSLKGGLLIEKNRLYKMSISNLVKITKMVLNKFVPYGGLLNAIFESPQLFSTEDYILTDFDTVVSDYIDQKADTDKFENSEDILIKILNSSKLSVEQKCKYLENNIVKISELNRLAIDSTDDKIFEVLFDKDLIFCSSDNINEYWNSVKSYLNNFVEYLNRNINASNATEIFGKNKGLCYSMMRDISTNDIVFEAAVNYAEDGLAEIGSDFKQDRIRILIEKDLLEPTEENVKVLLEKSYNEELLLLANSYEKEVVDLLSAESLSEELIYSLINSNLSTSSCLILIKKLNDGILLEKVNLNKIDLIEIILDQSISPENIAYICNDFQSFTLKEEFIRQLDNYGDLERLDNKYLSDSFMEYVLKQEYIDIETKISLIETKITNDTKPEQLREYISLVDEISDLATVWENKQPALDNEYKEQVGEKLIDKEYVKIRNSKDVQRLMLNR